MVEKRKEAKYTGKRVLLFATTTGYQTRSFGEAAERLGVQLVFATDRCQVLDDPWRDQAVPIHFHDEAASVQTVLDTVCTHPIDGIVVVGDRPTVIASRVAQALDLQGHPPEATAIARNKFLMRERLREAGLPVPAFVRTTPGAALNSITCSIAFPCVVKPIALSGSRGVIRADNPRQLLDALDRVRALFDAPDVRAERNDAHQTVLVERFIPGREYAVEGLLDRGDLRVLAIFDKPDPLDGPFFEETIYVTPSTQPPGVQDAIVRALVRGVRAIGLQHGPIHAECRVNDEDVFLLEIAARPIGGLCARSLRFESSDAVMSYEELMLRHALGEATRCYTREAAASGVMMIPIPRRGVLRRVDGIEAARNVPHIDDICITAKPDQVLIPLPEGASYLGFIFARAAAPQFVERSLRDAHARLTFAIDPELPVLRGGESRYNQSHG
jgi:biotin carboxylase